MTETSLGFIQTAIASGLGFLCIQILDGFVKKAFASAKTKEDQVDADASELERVVLELKDIGISYWCKDFDESVCYHSEASIVGKLTFCAHLVTSVFSNDVELKRSVDIKLNSFDEALTGGDFQVRGRPADISRLVKLERRTYDLINHIRSCRRAKRSSINPFKH